MKRWTFSLLAAAVLSSLLFVSCSKDGPAGPAGATGPQGPQGPAGSPGPAGTANVIYSGWLEAEFEDGVAEIQATQLTEDILNGGDIKVYWNIGTPAAPMVVPVPCVVPIFLLEPEPEENQPDVFIDPYYEVGSIFLTSNYNMVGQFRYILIPGGTAARKAGGGGDIDWNDYNAVKQHLNLKD